MSGQAKNLNLSVEAKRFANAVNNRASSALKKLTNNLGRPIPANPIVTQMNRKVNSTCKKIWNAAAGMFKCKTQEGRKRSKTRRNRKH